jgi:hypothetical protein
MIVMTYKHFIQVGVLGRGPFLGEHAWQKQIILIMSEFMVVLTMNQGEFIFWLIYPT